MSNSGILKEARIESTSVGAGFRETFIHQFQLLLPSRVERFVALLTLLLVSLDALLIAISQIEVAWLHYLKVFGIALACIALARHYFVQKQETNIAMALRGVGLLIMFSACVSAFNYLMMPITRVPIDEYLASIDAALGFEWPMAIEFAADHPMINTIVRFAYLSTLPQLALIIIVLGMTGKRQAFAQFLVCISVTSILEVCFWGVFPTHGAKSLYTLPLALEQAANPVVNTAFGRDLIWLASNGAMRLSPEDMKGLIAFPSYHAVLACIALWYSRNVKWLFAVLLVPNLLIFPGTIMHGGHHLIDAPAGVLLFVLGAWIAAYVPMTRFSSSQAAPQRQATL